MGLLMHDWLLSLYYELSALGAGVEKHSLSLDNDKNTTFSYYEKGKQIPGQSSMVFIHGFSSNKEAWLPVVQDIPTSYHSILIDLPNHGETIGFEEEDHRMDDVIDKLKLFFDKMDLIEPMYMIGASIGGTVVAMFTAKYPNYVSMICLLAPPPIKKYESDLIRKLHAGMNEILLPETKEQFYAMATLLTVKKVTTPKAFISKYFKSRLRVLDQQKRILKSFLEYDYVNLEEYYEPLKYNDCPALIIWGRQDQLCVVDAADYFSKLLSDSEVIIFDDCGHFISYEKTQETAKSIMEFLDLHSYDVID